MARKSFSPALIIHGGAGPLGPLDERPARRRGMLEAVERGARVLRQGGSALDAAIEAVVALEDAPLFNAGYGSVLNIDGRIEMDASVMVHPPNRRSNSAIARHAMPPHVRSSQFHLGAGGVASVTRVRNPIRLARAVMEQTPHLLMVGAGAERLAKGAKLPFCRPEELIAPRARERWLAFRERVAALTPGTTDAGPQAGGAPRDGEHGTVGAVALDMEGRLAAATSTGGITGKMPGRVGDSAIVGAGTFADRDGAASATGVGEAIIRTMLCMDAVAMLSRTNAGQAAARAISHLRKIEGAVAGIIVVDRHGRRGWAHNAQNMEVATFDATGIRAFQVRPRSSGRRPLADSEQ